LITPLMGLASVHFGIGKAIVVPFLCFIFVAYYGLKGYKEKTEAID